MTYDELKEKRSLCFWNLPKYAGAEGCSVPLEKCAECKADKTMPLGLGAICKGGFRGICKKQMRGK